MTPVLPTIIQGPAIITRGANVYYTKGPIKVGYKRESFKIETDMHGQIDERILRDMTVISFTPDGQIGTQAKFFPYAVGDVGKSIMTVAGGTVIIQTLDGRTITWSRGAVSKFPKLNLKPNSTLYGDMEMTCIGKATTQRSDVAFWKVITAVGFADITFDETAIITDIYIAAFGGAPYNSMGALEGFEIDFAMSVKVIPALDVGIADIILSSLSATARWRPDNLTELQIDTLLNHSGANALYPGESFAKAGTNLVITGQGAAPKTFTLQTAGPKDITWNYGTGEHLHDVLEFTTRRKWTAGVAQPLITIA